MNKQEFLEELRRSLVHLPASDVDEIMRDQEEYIRDAVKAGRTEDEVIRSLGTPATFAAGLLAESRIQKAEGSTTLKKQAGNTFGALVAIVALAPLNLIFVFGPFVTAAALVVAGWAVALAALLVAISLLVAFCFKLIFISAGFWTHLSALSFSAGCIGVGLLCLLFMGAVSKGFLSLTVSYLKWNLNFIRARA